MAIITEERRRLINEHLDNKLSYFCAEFRKLTIENDHPYINTYLESALWEFREDLAKGRYYLTDFNELKL